MVHLKHNKDFTNGLSLAGIEAEQSGDDCNFSHLLSASSPIWQLPYYLFNWCSISGYYFQNWKDRLGNGICRLDTVGNSWKHAYFSLPAQRQLETSKCPSVREPHFAVAEIRSLYSDDKPLQVEFSTTRPRLPPQENILELLLQADSDSIRNYN